MNAHRAPPKRSQSDLSQRLLALAAEVAKAGPGSAYYKAHIEYLRRLINVLSGGGSIICDGELVVRAEQVGTEYPEKLFAQLDKEWQRLGKELDSRPFGLLPPVVAIVLKRCKTREEIPDVLRGPRDELASSRAKVWKAIDRARSASTVKEGFDAMSELDAAARAFIPSPGESLFASIRVFFEIIAGAAGGIATTVHPAGAILSGAGTPVVIEGATRLSNHLLRRGSMDLGRRLGREFGKIKPAGTVKELSRLLGQSARAKLGI